MKQIDISTLTEPLSADSPAGPDLEYDPAFVALEDAARTEPEQQFGDTIVAAEEPAWDRVRDLAVELLARSKDLRAALYLLQALVHGNGLKGLAQGLALIRALLEGFWDSLHPQLDPDDDLDPTARVNIVASLCDPALVLAAVRNAPMLQVPGLGGIAFRDLQIARGQLPPPPDAEEVLKLDSIEAAARDVELPMLKETTTAVTGAVHDTVAVEQFLTEKVGVTHAVSLDALKSILTEINVFLQEQLEARGGADVLDGGQTVDSATSASDVTSGPIETTRSSGVITCSKDVTDALDKIIAYYKTNEPSSPVPLLLQRAKRLVSSGFLEILRDIAPDGVTQAERVTGVKPEAGAD